MPNHQTLPLSVTADNVKNLGLSEWSPQELADLIEHRTKNERLMIFQYLDSKKASEVFAFLSLPTQKQILNSIPAKMAAAILNDLSPDDRTAFLEELPSGVVSQLLDLLTKDERALTVKLLSYPENSVGRLMTPDYVAIHPNWTVRRVLNHVRKYGHDSETINYLYVVDDKGKLTDDIRLRELLFASPDAFVRDLSDNRFTSLSVNDDDETAVNMFRKYDRFALPVVDDNGRLVGIVTIDDILHIADQEDTEDIQRIGGSSALEEPYIQTPLLELIRKRAGWLIVLFLGELLTASTMGFYEQEIAQAVVLTLFLPLIISSGGNSGSQATTLIIRAMTLREITLKDWFKVMKREIMTGLALGCILGFIGFFRVALWSQFSNAYGEFWLQIAMSVGIALIGVVMWGAVLGAMLPFVLRKFGLDPAVSSAPFVSTFVDVTGIIIYFSIAFVFLQGKLL